MHACIHNYTFGCVCERVWKRRKRVNVQERKPTTREKKPLNTKGSTLLHTHTHMHLQMTDFSKFFVFDVGRFFFCFFRNKTQNWDRAKQILNMSKNIIAHIIHSYWIVTIVIIKMRSHDTKRWKREKKTYKAIIRPPKSHTKQTRTFSPSQLQIRIISLSLGF